MPFFAGGESRDKLTLLYFLERAQYELTREQLTTAVAEGDFMQFFELQIAVNELEEQGLLAAVPRPYGQAYAVTEAGREMLDMFMEQLPDSVRRDIDEYAEKCATKLRNATQYSATYEKSALGCTVALRIMERSSVLLSLETVLPDQESAKHACDTWPERAGDVYRLIVNELHK